MDSVTSTSNSGMTYLTQLLSSPTSPLASSGLSSTQIQSVLQNASPSDIVQLSDSALQLQNIDSLFGSPSASQTDGLFSLSSPPSSGATLASILATLNPSTDSQAPTTTPAPSSLADQFSAYQNQLQSEQIAALFGTGSPAGLAGTSLNALA